MLSKKKILITTFIFLLFLAMLPTSCQQEGRGCALPKGDYERGKNAFVQLRCNGCHSVADVKWLGNPEELYFQLGGTISKKKTYGELVSSVINPSHKIAKQYIGHQTSTSEGSSKMAIYNEVMTVQELVDIVTFLQTEYKVEPPKPYYLDYDL